MPAQTVEISAKQDTVNQPIIWRLGKLFNVVTNIRRARISEEYGYVAVVIEGSTQEVEQAINYLHTLGLCEEGADSPLNNAAPEEAIPQPNRIYARLTTVTPAQARFPVLYRVGKDFNVVINIEHAAFDDEEGGTFDILIAGPLMEIQRAIAYLHTTGVQVNPRQRSVTDYSNL